MQPLDKTIAKTRDPDFVYAGIALKRAAQKAREKAKRIGAGVIVLKDGKIIEEKQDNTNEGQVA